MSEKNFDVPSETFVEGASCDPALTRKEFIKKVVKGAAIAGGLLSAPRVIDSFIAPAYAAGCSTCSVADTGGSFKDSTTSTGNCSGTDVINFSTGGTCGALGGN